MFLILNNRKYSDSDKSYVKEVNLLIFLICFYFMKIKIYWNNLRLKILGKQEFYSSLSAMLLLMYIIFETACTFVYIFYAFSSRSYILHLKFR